MRLATYVETKPYDTSYAHHFSYDNRVYRILTKQHWDNIPAKDKMFFIAEATHSGILMRYDISAIERLALIEELKSYTGKKDDKK